MTSLAPAAVYSETLTYVTQVQVLRKGKPYAILSEVLAGGSVSFDVTSTNLATLTFQCVDESNQLVQDGPTGLLQIGTELQIYAGYIINGVPVMWPLGIFGITQIDRVNSADQPGPIYAIQGTDRSLRVSANLLADTITIAAGSPVEVAVRQVLQKQASWLNQDKDIRFIGQNAFTSTVAQQVLQPGDDPWQDIVSLCASCGYVCYFDPNGKFVAKPLPSKAQHNTVLNVISGPHGLATSITKTKSANPGYNGVIVTGTSANFTSSSQVVAGAAFDMDPHSETYALGPYGYRPAPPVQDSNATSVAQCVAAAKLALPQVLGLNHQVALSMVPVPFLWPFDLMMVQDAKTGTNGTYVVSAMTVPFDPVAQQVSGQPLGTSLDYLSSIGGTPSLAAVTSIVPIFNGNRYFSNNGFQTFYGQQGGASTGAYGMTGLGGLGMAGYSVFGSWHLYQLLTGGRGYWRFSGGIWSWAHE